MHGKLLTVRPVFQTSPYACVSKVLEQDKYSLQKEVALKTRMLESLQSDYDCVKNQQRQQLQEQQEHLERSHSTAVSELNNKVQQPPHPHQRRRDTLPYHVIVSIQ